MAKIIEWLLILMIFGAVAVVGNWVGYDVLPLTAVPGILILVLITLTGMTLAKFIPGNFPSVGYVALVGIIISLPSFPGGEQVVEWTGHISILAIATPILAYAGISIGRSWGDFTKLGWRALVVATFVFLGTFLGSAVIAEIVLRIQGII